MLGDDKSNDSKEELEEVPVIDTQTVVKRATGEFEKKAVELTEPSEPPSDEPDRS